MLPGASACCVCGEREHKSSHCPTLYSPLTPGFYTGGGGGGHSHDDESSFGFFDMSIDENEFSKSNKLQRVPYFVHRRAKNRRATIAQPHTSIHRIPCFA
jgi:hypothetical protein